jgi:O-antigen/teichoic acid export membrane protein
MPLAWFLALMLVSAVFEIVMVARKRHLQAAITYAVSDAARTAAFVLPAFLFGSLHAVMLGAVAFAAARVAVMLVCLWREFRGELRIDLAVLGHQLAYALPFALAVGIEVVQINFHQYVVAARFDAATFAVYAVGCLQIPLVDLIMTSTTNVMMVKMAEDMRDGQVEAALELWHDTICRLAFLIFPLAAFLLIAARDVIVVLFTATYLASVPIFMLWSLTILPAAFAVDAVLRVYAQTRFLLVMNVARLALVAGLIGWCMSVFGLAGAVIVTLVATSAVKVMGIVRIARLMNARVADMLPWQRLAAIAVPAAVAAAPTFWVRHSLMIHPIAALACMAAVYGAVYAALHFGWVYWERISRSAEAFALRRSFVARRL